LGPENWTLATHGIIRPGKGYRQLLRWWQRIARLHPDWRLMIIGGGEGSRWCQRQIRRLGIEEQVIMTGWLPTQEDVNRCLNAADCLLVHRRNTIDNQGIITSALYHSLATGRPTLACGLPGFAEVIRDRQDGYLFKPDDFNSFQDALEHIADHPEEARQLGVAGRQRAEECFDPEQTANRFADLVQSIAAQSETTT
jgi:glycosyltransferase involved in cell wall biosynthesis